MAGSTPADVVDGFGDFRSCVCASLLAHFDVFKQLLTITDGGLAGLPQLAECHFGLPLALNFDALDGLFEHVLTLFDIVSVVLIEPDFVKVGLESPLGLLLLSLLLEGPDAVDPFAESLNDAVELGLFAVLQTCDVLHSEEILVDI